MVEQVDYGPRLSKRQYEREIAALYDREEPTGPDGVRVRRRREFDLTVDHRLGKSFPAEKRERLWVVQERVEKRRLRLVLHRFGKFFRTFARRDGATELAGFLLKEYAKVLSPAEMEAFFGKIEEQG